MSDDSNNDYDMSEEWFYKDVYTIDPGEVEQAWDKLSTDELPLMIEAIPKMLRQALIDTLRERKTLERFL